MIGAKPPTFHQREDSMDPGQHDMAGHLADRPRVVSVIGQARIRSVPVGEQRRSGLHVGPHKSLDRSRRVVRDSGETDAPRPSIQVLCSFPPWLGLVCSAVDHLDSTKDKDLPGFHGIEKAVVGPERNFGLVDLHHALESGVSSRPIEPKSLSTSTLQRVVYYLPDEVVPSPSPIRSSRSAKSNNSCWICAIGVCRASCLIFSAIARLSSPLPSRSLLIGVSSTESDSRRRRGASVSLPIGTPERAIGLAKFG